MARPGNVRSFTFSGTMPGGERFAFGLWAPGPPGQVNQAGLNSIAGGTLVTAMVGQIAALNNSGTVLNQLTFRQYATSGGPSVETYSSSISGGTGSGAAVLPNQVALAVTLRSAVATGRGRGRFYIPLTGAAISASTGRITSGLQGLATAVANFVSSIDGVVVSEADSALRDIISVDVGNVADTIRRRRDKLVEARVSASVA